MPKTGSGQKPKIDERTAELLAASSARRKTQEAIEEQARFLEAFFDTPSIRWCFSIKNSILYVSIRPTPGHASVNRRSS